MDLLHLPRLVLDEVARDEDSALRGGDADHGDAFAAGQEAHVDVVARQVDAEGAAVVGREHQTAARTDRTDDSVHALTVARVVLDHVARHDESMCRRPDDGDGLARREESGIDVVAREVHVNPTPVVGSQHERPVTPDRFDGPVDTDRVGKGYRGRRHNHEEQQGDA